MAKKAKTYKAAQKRFKLTATGKVKHKAQNNNNHLKVNKTRAQKARQKGSKFLGSKKQTNKIKHEN
jgi:ribosomal protein L35